MAFLIGAGSSWELARFFISIFFVFPYSSYFYILRISCIFCPGSTSFPYIWCSMKLFIWYSVKLFTWCSVKLFIWLCKQTKKNPRELSDEPATSGDGNIIGAGGTGLQVLTGVNFESTYTHSVLFLLSSWIAGWNTVRLDSLTTVPQRPGYFPLWATSF